MKKTTPDRRIARTQHSLHRALNSLILEKGYEATTIQDIVGHANVGRSTFYAHHGSKEALLLSGLEHLRAALLATVRETATGAGGRSQPLLTFSAVFFTHVHAYREILRALLASDSASVVTRKLKRLLSDVVRMELHRAQPEERNAAVPREALVHFTIDALFSILLWWFDRSPQRSPAEIDAIFRRLVLPALAAAGVAQPK